MTAPSRIQSLGVTAVGPVAIGDGDLVALAIDVVGPREKGAKPPTSP